MSNEIILKRFKNECELRKLLYSSNLFTQSFIFCHHRYKNLYIGKDGKPKLLEWIFRNIKIQGSKMTIIKFKSILTEQSNMHLQLIQLINSICKV